MVALSHHRCSVGIQNSARDCGHSHSRRDPPGLCTLVTFDLGKSLVELNCVAPLVVMTEAPAVTAGAATILRELIGIEGGELPHLSEDFIGTAEGALNGGFLLLGNSLRNVRIRQ